MKGFCSRRLEKSDNTPFVYVHSHTCFFLMLIVAGLGVRCICYTLIFADVVGGLPITIPRHLSVLMYLCNKFVIVLAIMRHNSLDVPEQADIRITT